LQVLEQVSYRLARPGSIVVGRGASEDLADQFFGDFPSTGRRGQVEYALYPLRERVRVHLPVRASAGEQVERCQEYVRVLGEPHLRLGRLFALRVGGVALLAVLVGILVGDPPCDLHDAHEKLGVGSERLMQCPWCRFESQDGQELPFQLRYLGATLRVRVLVKVSEQCPRPLIGKRRQNYSATGDA